MKLQKVLVIAACVGIFAGTPTAQATQITRMDTLTEKQILQSYYFDWNKNSTFRAALYKAFKSSNVALPAWVRQGAGPAAPARLVPAENTKLVLLNTCMTGKCGDNELYVLFNPMTKALYGVVKVNAKATWIGNPNGNIKQLLSTHSGIR